MRWPFFLIGFCLLYGCGQKTLSGLEKKKHAEQLFRSVYAGDTLAIDSLVTSDVISTYPIYEELFGKKVISGRQAYKQFSTGFSKRWENTHLTVDKAIEEEGNVVFVWTFRATKKGTTPDSSFVDGREYSWGGITLFTFDTSGKITAEIGEESTPGPFGRMKE